MKISYSIAFIASIVALTKAAPTVSSAVRVSDGLPTPTEQEITTTATTETTSTLTSEELPVEGTDEKAMQDIWWGAYPAALYTSALSWSAWGGFPYLL
eukprot:Pgem_evm1s2913